MRARVIAIMGGRIDNHPVSIMVNSISYVSSLRQASLRFSFLTQKCHFGALGIGSCFMSALITLLCVNKQHATSTHTIIAMIVPVFISVLLCFILQTPFRTLLYPAISLEP